MSLTTMTSGRSLAGGDVVQRLPGHAAGERAVADHRDDGAVALPAQRERLGQPVRLGQRGGGVGVLDPVVLGSRPGSGSRTGRLVRSRVEPVGPAGEDLVHVGLVAGVEQDGSRGESNTRCSAMVSSTTPRFGPRCPPPLATLLDQESRISAASVGELDPATSPAGRSGEVIRPSGVGGPCCVTDASRRSCAATTRCRLPSRCGWPSVAGTGPATGSHRRHGAIPPADVTALAGDAGVGATRRRPAFPPG